MGTSFGQEMLPTLQYSDVARREALEEKASGAVFAVWRKQRRSQPGMKPQADEVSSLSLQIAEHGGGLLVATEQIGTYWWASGKLHVVDAAAREAAPRLPESPVKLSIADVEGALGKTFIHNLSTYHYEFEIVPWTSLLKRLFRFVTGAELLRRRLWQKQIDEICRPYFTCTSYADEGEMRTWRDGPNGQEELWKNTFRTRFEPPDRLRYEDTSHCDITGQDSHTEISYWKGIAEFVRLPGGEHLQHDKLAPLIDRAICGSARSAGFVLPLLLSGKCRIGELHSLCEATLSEETLEGRKCRVVRGREHWGKVAATYWFDAETGLLQRAHSEQKSGAETYYEEVTFNPRINIAVSDADFAAATSPNWNADESD